MKSDIGGRSVLPLIEIEVSTLGTSALARCWGVRIQCDFRRASCRIHSKLIGDDSALLRQRDFSRPRRSKPTAISTVTATRMSNVEIAVRVGSISNRILSHIRFGNVVAFGAPRKIANTTSSIERRRFPLLLHFVIFPIAKDAELPNDKMYLFVA